MLSRDLLWVMLNIPKFLSIFSVPLTLMKEIPQSPLALEAIALDKRAYTRHSIAYLLQETFLPPNLPKITCMTDTKSLLDTLKNVKNTHGGV